MENKELVSVIMPAYNCEKYINQAIDCILNQTYSHLELLIADDCSTDYTKNIINSYSDLRIKTFHNTTNKGYLVASNLLMKKAKGNYIVFQDADDYCSINRIEILVNEISSVDTLFAVGSNVCTINENNIILSTSNFPLKHNLILESFSNFRNPIIGSALLFKKEVLTTIGFYDMYFNRIGWEDYYWFSQIIQKYKVSNVLEPLYYYRSNPLSVSNQNKSFKSIAGFETVVYYLNQQILGRENDILNKNYKLADRMMARNYISLFINQNKKVSLKKIYQISNSTYSFFILFIFKIKRALLAK